LPGRIARWRIVETPAMAEAGNQLFQTAALTFHDDLNAATRGTCRDLLMAQGVLQYTRDPIRAWNDLFQRDFDFVYVTRTLVGVDLAQPVITKQIVPLSEHGPGAMPVGLTDRFTSQPLTIVAPEMLRVPANYRVAFSFVESPETVMRIGAQRVATRNMGWLLKKIAK
jgi:putative methyltransferase (TIGR04325 family)